MDSSGNIYRNLSDQEIKKIESGLEVLLLEKESTESRKKIYKEHRDRSFNKPRFDKEKVRTKSKSARKARRSNRR